MGRDTENPFRGLIEIGDNTLLVDGYNTVVNCIED
jgi:hypothetical protein